MNWKQKPFKSIINHLMFSRFVFNVICNIQKKEILKRAIPLTVCIFIISFFLNGCVSIVKPPFLTGQKPFISSVEPVNVDPNNAPITVTVRGKGFQEGAIVRVALSADDSYFKDIKPIREKSNELSINLDSKFFEDSIKVKTPFHSSSAMAFQTVLNIEIINPNGQKSNCKQVNAKYAFVRINQVSFLGPLKIKPGSRQEIVVSIERGAWCGDVPLQVIGFNGREIQPGALHTANQVPYIVGKTVIPAGASSAKLPIEVTSDVQPGKYKVFILGEHFIKRIGSSLTSSYVPASAHEVVEIEVMGPDYECYTCKPFAPEIVEFQRTSEGYIRILFDDRSSNEKGFRIKRFESTDHLWEEIGTVEGTTSRSYGEFIDTAAEPGQGYNYLVEAWNDAGISQSITRYADPPYPVPSNLTVFHRQNDILLWWLDNSEESTEMTILRREANRPNARWSVIRDLSVLSSEGTGPMSCTDPSPNRNLHCVYKIRAGNPNPETGTGATYSEEAHAYPIGVIPAVPSNLTIFNDEDEGHHIRWMDNATNEFRYWIYRYVNPADRFKERVADIDAHSGTGWMEKRFSNDILPSDTTVYYDVVAVRGDYGSSLVSENIHIGSLVVPEKPGTPVFPKVEARSLTISWEDNSRNEAGFKIERKRSGSDNWINMGSVEAHPGTGKMEWKNSGLLPSTQYCYRVTAFNDAGSNRSREGCKTTLAAPGPELVINSFSVDSMALQAGPNTPFSLYYIVFNMGNLETGNFVIQLCFPDSNGQPKTENINVNSLPSNGYYIGQKDFSNGLSEGCYHFGIVLDINNNVSEQSEQPGYIWDLTQTPYNPFNEAFVERCWW